MSALPKREQGVRETLPTTHQWVRLAQHIKNQPLDLTEGDIALLIGDDQNPKIHRNVNRLILGRKVPSTRPFIEELVDLAAYDGGNRGVSRLHAAISRAAYGFVLTDLNSRNGTYLNGRQLPSKQKRTLSHGDMLQLGNLDVAVYLAGKQQPTTRTLNVVDTRYDMETMRSIVAPAYLADELFSLLAVLADIQELIGRMRGGENEPPHVERFSAVGGNTEMQVEVRGMDDIVKIMEDLLIPWKKSKARTIVAQIRVMKRTAHLLVGRPGADQYDISTTPITIKSAVSSSRKSDVFAYQALNTAKQQEFLKTMTVLRNELATPIVSEFGSKLHTTQQSMFIEKLMPLLFSYFVSRVDLRPSDTTISG